MIRSSGRCLVLLVLTEDWPYPGWKRHPFVPPFFGGTKDIADSRRKLQKKLAKAYLSAKF